MFSVVAVNGSPQQGSRTGLLISHVLASMTELFTSTRSIINLSEAGPELLVAMSRNELTPRGRRLTSKVEEADLLLIGTPVYGGSFTGVLKHFLDLLDTDRLTGKPAIIIANGEHRNHEFLMEQQLRPLLSVMGFRSLYPFIFGSDSDFVADDEISPRLVRLISEAADEAFKTLLNITYKSLESFAYASQSATAITRHRKDN